MIRCTFERELRRKETPQCIRQFCPRGIEYGNMVQAGCGGRWWLASRALPSVEADVVMIATGGQERRLRPVALSDFKEPSTSR
jgi:hypothetical protein